jgi:hypothetical protein
VARREITWEECLADQVGILPFYKRPNDFAIAPFPLFFNSRLAWDNTVISAKLIQRFYAQKPVTSSSERS